MVKCKSCIHRQATINLILGPPMFYNKIEIYFYPRSQYNFSNTASKFNSFSKIDTSYFLDDDALVDENDFIDDLLLAMIFTVTSTFSNKKSNEIYFKLS